VADDVLGRLGGDHDGDGRAPLYGHRLEHIRGVGLQRQEVGLATPRLFRQVVPARLAIGDSY